MNGFFGGESANTLNWSGFWCRSASGCSCAAAALFPGLPGTGGMLVADGVSLGLYLAGGASVMDLLAADAAAAGDAFDAGCGEASLTIRTTRNTITPSSAASIRIWPT